MIAASEKLIYLKNQFNTFVKPYHEKLSSKAWSTWRHHIPKTFSFESSKYLLGLCFADSRIVYFWQALESIHKFIIEMYVLQGLFIRTSKKNKGGVEIFQISQKEILFNLLWLTNALGVILQYGLLLKSSKKGLSLLFSLVLKIIYLNTQLKGELNDLLWKLPGCFHFPQVGIWWWTLVINITLTCKRV